MVRRVEPTGVPLSTSADRRWTNDQLIDTVKGFYVSWANDPPNPKIKDWNVTELKVSLFLYQTDKIAYPCLN